MLFADLPPHLHERVVCSIAAAVKYEIPANIVLAVAEKEGGKPGQWVRNSDGSHDVGTMQFNTAYLRDLAPYGITRKRRCRFRVLSLRLGRLAPPSAY